MNYRLFRFKTVIVFMMIVVGLALAQESGYLTQKLMVENDLRTRIREALSKIIDPAKYVVDVSIELEMSDSFEEQVTILPGNQSAGSAGMVETPVEQLAGELEDEYSQDASATMGLPIPGFEFEVDGGTSSEAPAKNLTRETPQAIQSTSQDRVTSKMSSIKRAARAKILHQSINIIIQEGIAPEMIENIRQIVTVASQFNLQRGDQLNLMTATFRERRDAKTAEQVILKSISDKIENLEKKRVEDAAAEDTWEDKLKRYKDDEAKRRQEDRQYFKTELDKLEIAARQRAFDNEKANILEQDSVRLYQLSEEVKNLRAQLASPAISDSQAQEVKSQVTQREGEMTDLDQQIADRIKSLDSVQAELDKMQKSGNSSGMTILVSVLGAMLLLAIIALIIILMNKSKTPAYPPPPYMYPPRRRKKKRKTEVSSGNGATGTAVATPAQPIATEDPGVLQSEIGDIRKSIVSMSVGQPETAARIVKEWIQEAAPPPPPEETAPAQVEEEPEDEKPKKKKKKKK